MIREFGFIKALLVAGLAFTIVGGIIFAVAMTSNGWDFGVLASHSVQKRVVEITNQEEIESVSSVKVNFSTACINIVYHNESKITVEGYDVAKRNGEVVEKLSAKVANGELVVTLEKIKPVNFEMGISSKRVVTIKLPKDMVVNLSVTLSTGDVFVGEKGKAIAFNDATIKTSTGDVGLNGNVKCNKLSVENTTGDTFINGKLTANSFTRNATTGDLIINAKVEAQSINVTNSTGDVICNNYITANTINIKTSTGDVILKLLGSKADYNYSYNISSGDSNIPAISNPSATKTVSVTCKTGDSNVYFEK